MAITSDEISRIKRFEGSVNHFYVDTTGHVTIGYGHMVANVSASVALSLVRKNDGLPAPTVEKQTEWTTIKSKPYGQQYPAGYYDQFCKLMLSQPNVDALLTKDLTTIEHQLSTRFTNYSRYPETAKAGLVDMGFNLGVQGIFNSFPNFAAAVQKQDWRNAANECYRPRVEPARNAEVKQLFLQSVTKPGPVPVPGPGTGGTGTIFNTMQIPDWLKKIPAQEPLRSVKVARETTSAPTAIALPAHLLVSCFDCQGIVAIVALSSNVTTAAITAITAIADVNKR